jgi:hypothetical protein
MKAETYVTSKQGGTEYGYQLTSDDGEFIMDMVLGEEYAIKDDIEKQFEKHRPLINVMVAAPELLSALQKIVDGLPSEYDDKHTNAILENARDAIAKAKGGTQ